MIQATKLFFKNYVNFNGRSRRSEYWWPMLSLGIIEMLLVIVMYGFLIAGTIAESGAMLVVTMIVLVIWAIFSLAIIVPSISVAVRRLHDTGKSGWWYFIAFVPMVGGIVLFIFMCSDSQPGANQWGPNPKGL